LGRTGKEEDRLNRALHFRRDGAIFAADVVRFEPGRILDKATTYPPCPRAAPAHRRVGRPVLGRGLFLLGFLAGAAGALAQGILAPSSANFEKSTYAPSLLGYQTGGIPPFAGFLSETVSEAQMSLLQLHPYLDYQYTYGDSIPSSPTNHSAIVAQTISTGLGLAFGRQWTLTYGASFNSYSSRQFSDEVNQNLSLNGSARYEDWSFSLSQAYSYSDSPMVETEAQTAQAIYSTALSASRRFGSHLSAQWSLDQNIASASGISGSTTNNSQNADSWVASSGLFYQTDYRADFGINGSVGFNLITPGANSEFAQVMGSVNWQPLAKLAVAASVGVEDTQLNGAQLTDPTFSASINYQPFQHTSASLIASRSISPSLYQDDVIVSTAITATLRQRLLQHLDFEVSGGYSTTPYVGFATVDEFTNNHQIGAPTITSMVEQNRSDISRYLRVSLGTTIRKRGSVSVFYSYSDTTSSLSAFALAGSQIGFELGWQY
jgi:hypothetical protein